MSIEAYDLMVKDLKKFKLYKSAYDFQYVSFQNYANESLKYFAQVQEAEIKMHALQIQLDNSIEALRKKKSNWLLPTTIGVVGGLIGGLLLVN